jgi:hypothetical protein
VIGLKAKMCDMEHKIKKNIYIYSRKTLIGKPERTEPYLGEDNV